MKLAILSDFDDTAAQQNVAHLVLDRFSETDWRPLLEKFHQGTIKPRDYFEMPFRPITASKHDMQAYVRSNGPPPDRVSLSWRISAWAAVLSWRW